MANEIKIVATLQVTKGSLALFKSGSMNLTLNGNTYAGGAISISITPEPLDLNGLTDLGYMYVRNTSTTDSVSFGNNNEVDEYGVMSSPFLYLKPTEFALLRLSPLITVYAQSDGAAVVDYIILSD